MLFEINLCCPGCGGHQWHKLDHAEAGEWCCAECGTVCTTEEMTAYAYDI